MRTSTIANERRRARFRPARRRTLPHALLAVACACLAFVAAGGPALAADSSDAWPQFGQNAAHTGESMFDTPQPPYAREWKFAMPGKDRSLSAPMIVGDTVIALSTTAVYGVDLATGEERWRVDRDGGQIFATPAVADVDGTPVLLFTQGDTPTTSALVAYSLADPDSPVKLWEVGLQDETTSGVSVDGNTAFTGDLSGNVYAIDVATEAPAAGSEDDLIRWTEPVSGVLRGPPAASEGTVVVSAINVTTQRVEIAALDEETGKEHWTFPASATATQATPVTISGDRAIVGFGEPSGGGVLTALSLSDGLTLWSTRFSSQFFVLTDIVVQDGYALAFGAHLGLEAGLYRVRISDGARSTPWNYGTDGLWSFEFDTSGVLSSPVAVGGSVVLGLDDGRMAAIDADTGLLVWRTETGEAPLRGLAAGDGILVASIGSRAGGLVAFRTDPDGTLLAEVSSSKPNWGEMLGNYAIAFVGIGALAALIALLVRGRGERAAPVPRDEPGADDVDDPDGEESP